MKVIVGWSLIFHDILLQAVYKIPTEGDDITKSEALALQKVFYDMQFSDEFIDVRKLTSSLFDWDDSDSFTIYDLEGFLSRVSEGLPTSTFSSFWENFGTNLFYFVSVNG